MIYVIMETSVKSAYHSVLCVLPHILVNVGTGNLNRKFVSLASLMGFLRSVKTKKPAIRWLFIGLSGVIFVVC